MSSLNSKANTAPSTPLLGKRVFINGLAAKSELNGRTGTAVSFDDAEGRYSVELDWSHDGTFSSFMIKPCNLLLNDRSRSNISTPSPGAPWLKKALPPPMPPHPSGSLRESIGGPVNSPSAPPLPPPRHENAESVVERLSKVPLPPPRHENAESGVERLSKVLRETQKQLKATDEAYRSKHEEAKAAHDRAKGTQSMLDILQMEHETALSDLDSTRERLQLVESEKEYLRAELLRQRHETETSVLLASHAEDLDKKHTQEETLRLATQALLQETQHQNHHLAARISQLETELQVALILVLPLVLLPALQRVSANWKKLSRRLRRRRKRTRQRRRTSSSAPPSHRPWLLARKRGSKGRSGAGFRVL